MSTSLIAEFAASRFCVCVEIDSDEKLNRDSWAPIEARAADTVLMALSSKLSAEVAPDWLETSSVLTPSELEVRLVSVMLMVSLPEEPTIKTAAYRAIGAEDMVLADDIGQFARTQPVGQRMRRVLLHPCGCEQGRAFASCGSLRATRSWVSSSIKAWRRARRRK